MHEALSKPKQLGLLSDSQSLAARCLLLFNAFHQNKYEAKRRKEAA